MKINLEHRWKKVLSKEFEKPYFEKLSSLLKSSYVSSDVWPKSEDIFTAFNKCHLAHIKVVILGQDPYPTPGHAHGLSFSVPSNIKPLAKSLKNIFKELESDLGIPQTDDGNLERWAEQGVFLLNSILTVNAHEPNSHKTFGWQTFTDEVIKTISTQKKGVVFLLWGAQAQKKIDLIDQSKHHILKSAHPSPLSAYRGFFGCKHFSKANELLISQNINPINW